MQLDFAEPFADTGWHVSSLETPAFAIHAVFRLSTPRVGFGMKGQIDIRLARQLIKSIDESTIPHNSFSTEQLARPVKGFDFIAAICGSDRQFARGWRIDSSDFVHVIPVFPCELTPDNHFPYERLRRLTDLFDLQRRPEPYFELKLRGGDSQLRVDDWSYATYSELQGFISILQNEPGSELLLRNRQHDILELPVESDDWGDVDSIVAAHLQIG
jgi:hypothetical protein